MKVFLTGATGFVGSALSDQLVSNGAKVFALVRNERSVLPYGVEKIVGDLLDVTSLRESDSSIECNSLIQSLSRSDVVIHAAARAHIMHEKLSDPLSEYRKINRDVTISLAKIAASAGVKRFVFVSSIKVNGEFTLDGEPFTPNDSNIPEDPYGLSKYEAERGLIDISNSMSMEVVIIRPPLVYGPRVKGNFSAMISWINKGWPLPLGAVNNMRSMVALDNLVDFIVLCSNKELSPRAANELFLISDGADVSTTDLLRKVAIAFGSKSILLPIPVRLMYIFAQILGKKDVANRLFGNLQVDISKAQYLLGWQPKVTMEIQLSKLVVAETSQIKKG